MSARRWNGEMTDRMHSSTAATATAAAAADAAFTAFVPTWIIRLKKEWVKERLWENKMRKKIHKFEKE